ncbi:AbrB family transcriptional regulator [Ahrensia kielensis]|uniref:AbrB family transcriptional regulator n=1 Tax=Ahrensia kielensis TaxID=76980 RepID=UPI00036B423F|nr:AbrB family transcriptional regulator [Ahrensia kielensis]
MNQELQRFAVALAAGSIGGALAMYLHMPAPALVGSTIAVTICALMGAKPQVPNIWRNTAFAIIGLTLGAGITPTILSDISRFSFSLVLLTVTLVIATLVATLILKRFFATDSTTALLATSPGALSYALVLAVDKKADVRTVTVLQGIRLFAITVFLPPLVTVLGGELPSSAHAEASTSVIVSLVLLVGAFLLAKLFEKFNLPAAWLIAGLIVSGIAHGAGWVNGRPWEPILFIGFVVAGGVIGSRFGQFKASELRKLAVAGVVLSTLAISISAIASALAAPILGVPFGQVWVSYAPGGVEGMAAIALSLGYDPVFVATHHIFRLFMLIIILPLIIAKR